MFNDASGAHLIQISMSAAVAILTPLVSWVLVHAAGFFKGQKKVSAYDLAMAKVLDTLEMIWHELTASGMPAASDPKELAQTMLDRFKQYLGDGGLAAIEHALGVPDNGFVDMILGIINKLIASKLALPSQMVIPKVGPVGPLPKEPTVNSDSPEATLPGMNR